MYLLLLLLSGVAQSSGRAINFLATEANAFSSSINVFASRFQADAAFDPDKTPLWLHPVAEDGWVHAHNALRGEIDVMGEVLSHLGRRPLKAWEVSSLQSWYSGHEEHVLDHHHNEDNKFTPYMATRINLPAKLTTDHVPLVKMLDALGASIHELREGGTAVGLRRAWTKYARMMKPHLLEEEQVALPLLRAYFTPPEVGKLVESILSESPPVSLGSFLYFMGGTRETVKKFMDNEGIPFFVWFLAFKGHVQVYHERMVRHADALLSGVPPTPVSQSSAGMIVLTIAVLAASLAMRRRFARRIALPPSSPTKSRTRRSPAFAIPCVYSRQNHRSVAFE